ncbi:hypothetical protein V492_08038, partial [Pseudogymnoascus sp. VKM F-4246]
MMCATNILASALTISYLLGAPLIANTPLGVYLGLDLTSAATGGEVSAAMSFLGRHPAAWVDVLGFAACGACAPGDGHGDEEDVHDGAERVVVWTPVEFWA